MKIPVIWLNYHDDIPGRGYWDQGMIEDIFSNRMWRTGYEFEHQEVHTLKGIADDGTGAVVVFPARNQVEFAARLNMNLRRFKWVMLMLTGDEEAAFPVEEIQHPNIKIWVMSPRPGRHDKYDKLGTGYPPHMREHLPEHAPEKDLDLFFSGQITHDRRKQMAKYLDEMQIHHEATGLNLEFNYSQGFTEGLEPAESYAQLSRAKVAPAPSGPETPDSFRLFEALEAGCMPIADTRVNKGDFPDDYWTFFFGEEPPFPVITEWEWLQGWTQDQKNVYPEKHNRVSIWWLNKKRELALKVKQQIKELSGIEPVEEKITVLMPSSPVPRHPSTDHIEQTIRDVRVQLPNADIIIMLDGVRTEQAHRRADYEEYQRRLLWLCNHKWQNVKPLRFEEFNHQSGMVRRALELVTTPYILFVEHDAPLVPDYPIEWDGLMQAIETGQANAIRMHHEANVHPEHESLMLGPPEEVCGVKMRKTAQWSQRPHLTSTAFYRYVMGMYFTEKSRAFIEHGLYGPCVEAFNTEGLLGWNLWKLWLYHPDGEHIKRSYDLNSRDTDPNYESIF